jgi:membrane protein DedA with SNARE-associated domain
MNLFADYLQPLTNWLQAHPHWSLFITFLIALSESLAVIGSIIPGSVTMTAIGILAGSGFLRVDLTLIASTLGAICGDSLSYAIGYFYSDKLLEMWPFKKNPHWVQYGKDFFSRHGGKSVLFGRFFGPLRSIIPVIAGVVHMKQWQFLTVNVISGIGWSLLYVLPGVFIGAAGSELSAESASRLFVVILFSLIVIWFISLTLKWSFLKIRSIMKNNLHDLWLSMSKQSVLKKIYEIITPCNEINHYATAGLTILLLLSLFSAVFLFFIITPSDSAIEINVAIYLFFQSVQTSLFEAIFIICTQGTSIVTVATAYALSLGWFLYYRQFSSMAYLSLIVLTSSLIACLCSFTLHSISYQGIHLVNAHSLNNILVATSIYGFLFTSIHNHNTLLTNSLRSFILILLTASGLGATYLGLYWFTELLSLYFIGLSIYLLFYLVYRKRSEQTNQQQSTAALILLTLSMLIAIYTATALNFKDLSKQEQPTTTVSTIDESTWWAQKEFILPLYRSNRIGKRTNLLNIQYIGNLAEFKNVLEHFNWEAHDESWFDKILMRINDNSHSVKLPFFAQLYNNRKPDLLMSYQDSQNNLVLLLLMWNSSYRLKNSTQTLWIGTVYINSHQIPHQFNYEPFNYLLPALSQYQLKKLPLADTQLKLTVYPKTPYVLLIKTK